MIKKIGYILFFAVFGLAVIACTKDQLDDEALVCEEPITYSDVRAVITASCGYVQCHNGISENNYNSFAGLEPFLINGSFRERVFEDRDMPPSNATGPLTLTEEEINLLKCWEQNGFSQ